jgi:hypothetical protein
LFSKAVIERWAISWPNRGYIWVNRTGMAITHDVARFSDLWMDGECKISRSLFYLDIFLALLIFWLWNNLFEFHQFKRDSVYFDRDYLGDFRLPLFADPFIGIQ